MKRSTRPAAAQTSAALHGLKLHAYVRPGCSRSSASRYDARDPDVTDTRAPFATFHEAEPAERT